MYRGLRQSLTRLIAIGATTATLFVFIALWSSFSTLIQSHLDKEVTNAESALEKVFAEHYGLLSSTLDTLINTEELSAVTTLSKASSFIHSFNREKDSSNIVHLAIINLDHIVIASSSPMFLAGKQAKQSVAMAAMGLTHTVAVVNGELTYLRFKTIQANGIRFYLLIASHIQDEIIQSVGLYSNAYVNIIDSNTGTVLASTLPQHTKGTHQSIASELRWHDMTFLDTAKYVEHAFSLESLSIAPVKINFFVDIAAQVESFRSVQLTLFSLYILGLFSITLFALLWIRRVTKPINSVIKAINNIAFGRYENTFEKTGNFQEVIALEDAVEGMQQSISKREDSIRYQAQHDNLTGLFNRNYLEQYFIEQMREPKWIQVIGITVIGFRTINDLYGYSNGDNTLKTLAKRLLRWPGISARLAGGEVIYVTDEPLNDNQLVTLKHILEQPVESNLITIPVKVAMAVLSCPEDAQTTEELFRKLNIVSDKAIRTGAWSARYSDELEESYNRRLSITTELKRALATQQDELSMVYQPKIDLRAMKICSMEALIRWNSSKLGHVAPDEFIAIAEQAGLIEQVTKWVMRQTISDLAYFRRKYYDFTVAMNLSTQDIQNKVLLNELVALLTEKGLSPASLQLEITESDLVADATLAVENLSSLRALGFRFAIDDFGTGYSSLAYLKNLPVETIKIDKSFILSLATQDNDQQIVHTILSLASIFDLKVVAEGVEDAESLRILKEWGCDEAQGYFISRPLTRDDLEKWLRSSPFGK
ncbi:putative bifunctional diguanylate cyclase/phosphodiesterase [Alteromonas sp. BMJM2]|uniref:putative bifunctional diguanylate cyclase/phosphodiesterase n=1 Tax=Alteromonas sp. BMJM2 TaxID=2954241 RepID=UPI0022B48E7D|nr:bifunctional diguanylate cyclase/phosphodiesterase [Alteromonas sp. BMJM2]